MKTAYQTRAVATGGRNGRVVVDNGALDLEVRIPKSMGGSDGEYTNPEQLFAAGYAACFDSALNFVARMERLRITSTVTSTVSLMASDTDGFSISIALDVEVNGVEKSKAHELLEKAHGACPYSKAIRNNVDVEINLVESK